MIDESISTFLEKKHGNLNFNGLLEFMKASQIDFKGVTLKGPIGFATNLGVFLDLGKMQDIHEKLLFFVILHEIAHYKRIVDMGFDNLISLFSLSNFEDFCNGVINEEIIADRYGCLTYYILNKELFPRGATQQLEHKYNKDKYKQVAGYMFGIVQNKKENYNKLWESFIV